MGVSADERIQGDYFKCNHLDLVKLIDMFKFKFRNFFAKT